MRIKIIQNIAGPFEKLVTSNIGVFSPLRNAFQKQRLKNKKLPRYVQARKLKSGQIAYYWCPPHWARRNKFPLMSEALGSDLDKARERIAHLNDYLDRWRNSRST